MEGWIVTIKYVSWLWLSTFSLAPRLPTDHSQLKTSKLEVSGILARLKTQYVKMFPQWKIERVAACRIMAATLVFNVACKTVLQLLIVNLSQIRHVSAPHWSEIEGWLAHSLIGFCSVTLEDTKLLILMQVISIDPVSWMIRASDLSWESN